MRIDAITRERLVIECPNCKGEDFGVGHLETGAFFGPWLCDACDHEFFGVATSGGVDITDIRKRGTTKALTLLRFRDLYLVVDGYSASTEEDWYDYLFHSHQCPTNVLRRVLEVCDAETGLDPHGTLRYIASIEDNKANREAIRGEIRGFQDLLLLFNTDGTDAPTNWPEKERGLLPWLAEQLDKAKTRA